MRKSYSYCLEFSKKGLLRYISHLDLLRLFQRAVRRAEVPVIFSQGFHPIPKIKFERALKLGVESEGEKLFLQLYIPLAPEELATRLNSQLPPEIQIQKVSKLSN